MKYSLILATINRTNEIKRFLASLAEQSYRDFELIVIDQNTDDRLKTIIASYAEEFPIIHLHSAKGLSRARNVGLQHVTGDIIAFPDDDCWYPRDLLLQVKRLLTEHPEWDGITGTCEDDKGKSSGTRWITTQSYVKLSNVWRTAISISIFLRQEVVTATGNFDEGLGVGAGTAFGSGEETDYVIRALASGFKIFYEPSIVVYHPQSVTAYDTAALKRAISYGAGMGRVLRKHHYPMWFVFYNWLRPAGGAILSCLLFNFSKCRYHYASLMGRVKGWTG